MIEASSVHAFRLPTEEPESDGTLKWEHTDLILVTVAGNGQQGIGYTYANTATARMIKDQLLPLLADEDPLDVNHLWEKMRGQMRNTGRPGITSMAISAIDSALWDLKAKVLDLPLCKLLGQVHESLPVYASGGFTSYPPEKLKDKFSEWLQEGISMFKMKIGRNKSKDMERMEAARDTIGSAELFVDANGAYFPKEALAMAEEFPDLGISWYEEPITSDNLEGLKYVREHVPSRVNVTAGEYGYDLTYFRRMLTAGAVDILQADVSRCAGITGLLKVHTLCEAFHLPLSTHCCPSLHLHPALALPNMVHLEYFRDHVVIEQKLFEGAPKADKGQLLPDTTKKGAGIDFKFSDAEKYRIGF